MKKLLLTLTLALTTLVNAFTYQGELSQTGNLFDGTADFKFRLFNANANGAQVGVTDNHTLVNLINGRFVVDLDQWVGLYDGTPLWLQIEVDLNSTGSFITLNPRQKLEPAPYAEFAYDGAGGNGDITGVTAGTGLTGGGNSGTVTLSIDGNVVQNRVTGTCPTGQSIRVINQNGTVVCEIDDTFNASTLWSTTGNTGTNPIDDFIGTTDNQAFEIRTNGIRALRIEQATATSAANIIGGLSGNEISSGVIGSVITGGGNNLQSFCGINGNEICINKISGDYGFIGGGYGNLVQFGESSSILGGVKNRTSGPGNSITGGANNVISSLYSTINGGVNNFIDSDYSIIASGKRNQIGKFANTSWAGGIEAHVADDHVNSFVWNGSYPTERPLTTTGFGQFLARSTTTWFGNMSTNGGVFPDIADYNSPLYSFFNIDSVDGNPLRVRYDGDPVFMVFTNKGTSIGGPVLPAANGLRVAGETHLMDRVSIGTDVLDSQLNIETPSGDTAIRVRVDGFSKFIVSSNGGTSIGNAFAAATNGLRVEGETNLLDVVGIGTTTPNSTLHIDSPVGSIGLRVQIDGNTKLKVESNGGVAIGSNYNDTPTEGLKVKGDVEILGSLSKGGGSFKIDHPLDPENKYLYHSFVESPDMMNIYNGNIITDQKGEAWVEMPEWFGALNREFRYQLTVVEVFAQAIIGEKIKKNKFLIKTSQPNVEVSWQVTGVRHDAWAQKNRIPVEEEKKEQDKGKYLHPKSWNLDEKQAVGYKEE